MLGIGLRPLLFLFLVFDGHFVAVNASHSQHRVGRSSAHSVHGGHRASQHDSYHDGFDDPISSQPQPRRQTLEDMFEPKISPWRAFLELLGYAMIISGIAVFCSFVDMDKQNSDDGRVITGLALMGVGMIIEVVLRWTSGYRAPAPLPSANDNKPGNGPVFLGVLILIGGAVMVGLGPGNLGVFISGFFVLFLGIAVVVIGAARKCFARDQSIMVLDEASHQWQVRPIHNVKIGDFVLAADGAEELPKASRVFFAACEDPSIVPSATVVIALSGHTLEVTADHLVPRFEKQSGTTTNVPASMLRKGDLLVTAFDWESPATLRAVEKIDVAAAAVCDIKTESGTVVADGIVASVAATHAGLSKLAWLPVRMFPALVSSPARAHAVMALSHVIHGVYGGLLAATARGQPSTLATSSSRAVHSEL